ncbi:MAG: hypothetical protein AAGJ86_09065 [Pseudomonadota bacterium]
MKTQWIAATSLALSLVAGSAAADDDNLWLGLRAGTQGLGLEATWRPVPYLDLRAGFNTYDYDTDREEAGINYDVDVDLSSAYLTLNARVPLSPFRFSAGLVANGNEGGFIGTDTGTYTIGGETFNATDVGTLRGKATFDSVSPYAGVGLDFRVFDTFGLHFDAGAMYQGEAELSLAADGALSSQQAFQDALERERIELQDEISDYKWYPVVAVAFSVNF